MPKQILHTVTRASEERSRDLPERGAEEQKLDCGGWTGGHLWGSHKSAEEALARRRVVGESF